MLIEKEILYYKIKCLENINFNFLFLISMGIKFCIILLYKKSFEYLFINNKNKHFKRLIFTGYWTISNILLP